MSKNIGMSARVGRKNVSSNVKWIEYNIHWNKLAKNNCKVCHGRGFEGFEPQTEEEKENNLPKTFILCNCVAEHWSKIDDSERMKFATKKENAEEILKQTKETIKEMMQDEISK